MAEVNGVGKKVAIGAGIAAGAAGVAGVAVAAKKGKINFQEVKDTFSKMGKEGDEAKLTKRFTATVSKVWEGLKEGFKEIGDSISKKFGEVKEWFAGKFGKAKDAAEDTVDVIVE